MFLLLLVMERVVPGCVISVRMLSERTTTILRMESARISLGAALELLLPVRHTRVVSRIIMREKKLNRLAPVYPV